MRKFDTILVGALIIGFIFCLHGIHWGRVESWNPDQMAFVNLFKEGELPLNPGWFHKPPFHTYTVFFLSIVPVHGMGKILGLSRSFINQAMLVWSRILTVFMFLGSITLVYYIVLRFFSRHAARIIAIIFATSAGFVATAHFLTTDIPVMFWMLVAFFFAQKVYFEGNTADYALAGLFTGIAAATKYNGLGVGIAIVASHALSGNVRPWREMLISRKLYLGLFMVIVGFFLGNPYALLDYSTFVSDFIYNYTVTPMYSGAVVGHGYWQFLTNYFEIIGIPSSIVFSIAVAVSMYFLFFERKQTKEWKGMILLLSVFLLYFYKIGSFPRIPARFVLPIVPFSLMLSGPFWDKIEPKKIATAVLVSLLLTYNIICSYYVGKRFNQDPRMAAQTWVKEEIKNGSSIESSHYVPNWIKLSGVNLNEERMPVISGRKKQFEEQFSNDAFVGEKLLEVEHEDHREDWYSREKLMTRKPEYIAVNSLYYDRFIDGPSGGHYPVIKQFFEDLLDEKYPYKIVFDEETKKYFPWLYPREIDFLRNRMTILKIASPIIPVF